MEVVGRDHEPPLFTGPGHFHIGPERQISFVMHAKSHAGTDAFSRLLAARKHPYDFRHQFRVNGTSYDSVDWSGGWTDLFLGKVAHNVWRLSGTIESLHTLAKGNGVAERSGVELVFERPLRLPLPMNMVTSVHCDEKQVLWSRGPGAQTVQVLDTNVEFFRSPDRDHTWIVAETSPQFPHPHLENWLSEPLSPLLGEVAVPSLLARNFGDGRAHISFRPLRQESATSLLACMLRQDPLAAGEKFWSVYRDLLTLVATARNEQGSPNFEAHPLTRYYREVIRAGQGSNWVLCMTLASTAEGVVKLLYPAAEQNSDWPATSAEELKKVISAWPGDRELKRSVVQHLSRPGSKSIRRTMRTLVTEGAITNAQVKAWERLRHSSMHGEMAIPWADEVQETQIGHLIELTHRLCEAYVARTLGNPK